MKTDNLVLNSELSRQVAELYQDMETAYSQTAEAMNFSCAGCQDNCCDSYFLHHTYTEWLYLWQGLNNLDESQMQAITRKAEKYILESEALFVRGKRPVVMCPLNSDGLCTLYSHRLMICRLHGVPASFTMPDGRKMNFPGCFRCQERSTAGRNVPPLDRTKFFKRLVDLETGLLGYRRMNLPRVKLTIAEMIIKGSPKL